MQWDSDNTGSSAIPMQQNDDMWVFGATEFTSVNGDGYSAGQGTDPYVYQDAQNDVQWEAIPEPGFVQYEVVRKLQTGDTAGHDIQFEPTQTYHLFTASTNHHGIDNEITDYQFELTTIKLGEAPLTNQNVVPTVDMPVFLIKYLNSALAFGIGLLFVVLLPAVLLSRRSFV